MTDSTRTHEAQTPTETRTSKLIAYKESYALLGCLFEVRKLYGHLHKEMIYHRAVKEIFSARQLSFVDQPKIPINSFMTGTRIGWYNPDFLIADLIILELKALPFVPHDQELRALEYLKASEYEILYLANFGERQFNPRRFIFTNDRKPFLAIRSQ